MEQEGDIDPERSRDLVDGVDSRVSDGSLDFAYEFVAEAGTFAERFLRPSALLTQIADARAKPGLCITHAASIRGGYPRKNPPKATRLQAL